MTLPSFLAGGGTFVVCTETTSEGVRLVALTGYGLENDRRRTRGAGFDEHFVEPIVVVALDAALRALRPQRT